MRDDGRHSAIVTLGLTLALISLAVAMDATAVCAGMALRGIRPAVLAKLALVFGAFQLVMAAAGGYGGVGLTRYIGAWDHWVAFLLLGFVGGRMIHEALEDDHDEQPPDLSLMTVLLLGVATSIDSLAVGVTLPTLDLPILLSALVIGATTFLFSLAGAHFALQMGRRFGPRLEIAGGLVLIAIGIKSVADHYM
ncbi:MAG TPA: manganese efflux pump MntP family protein [Thermoanaerobaculia bacterium]|nr:manganese efflux pump MntP family protein [Thermoanaerobaculia bacterium]